MMLDETRLESLNIVMAYDLNLNMPPFQNNPKTKLFRCTQFIISTQSPLPLKSLGASLLK